MSKRVATQGGLGASTLLHLACSLRLRYCKQYQQARGRRQGNEGLALLPAGELVWVHPPKPMCYPQALASMQDLLHNQQRCRVLAQLPNTT